MKLRSAGHVFVPVDVRFASPLPGASGVLQAVHGGQVATCSSSCLRRHDLREIELGSAARARAGVQRVRCSASLALFAPRDRAQDCGVVSLRVSGNAGVGHLC